MKIFLTGASGCLGNNIVDYIIENSNIDLFVSVRNSSKIETLENKKITIKVIDLSDLNDLKNKIPPDIDAIIHCAGNVSYQTYDFDTQYTDNVTVTTTLIDFAKSLNKNVRFVFCSTIAADIKNNKNNYAKTKGICEELIKNSNLDYVILRPFVVVGKYDTRNYYKIFKLIQKNKYLVSLPGTVDFCSAYEVAKAHVVAATKPYNSLKNLYILGGKTFTWYSANNLIANLFNSRKSQMVAPKALLWMLSLYGEIKNRLFKSEADINFQFFNLLYSGVSVTKNDKIVSSEDLGYNHEIDMHKLFTEYIEWGKSYGYFDK